MFGNRGKYLQVEEVYQDVCICKFYDGMGRFMYKFIYVYFIFILCFFEELLEFLVVVWFVMFEYGFQFFYFGGDFYVVVFIKDYFVGRVKVY